ncbi:DUF4411 family protein [Pseudoduganella violacea]|uniref:Putative nucleic acid-binding protein n=1 Tax=Pseudoduganella violacea TaxID=1715466 RepID=A0A7W5B716_9BURK|nr:DUF4411 family protein [Pseudoduganella violacea]MBB3117714.1 putative nucleic acid-binding protein [Pseudoduganella violacea]
MQVFDTSSIIYAWDNYPIEQFPNLWGWLAQELNASRICLSEVVSSEILGVSSECSQWLHSLAISYLPVNDAILQEALRIKALLQIGAHYQGGVGENDLLVIATAKQHTAELITNEAIQRTLPKLKANYKIPAVCKLPTVAVNCCSFLDFMRRSKVVFG